MGPGSLGGPRVSAQETLWWPDLPESEFLWFSVLQWPGLLPNKNVVCYLPGVDALRAGYVFPLKQSPVHLDVPGEGVAGTQNGKNDPEREDSIVVWWYVVFTDSRDVCVCVCV